MSVSKRMGWMVAVVLIGTLSLGFFAYRQMSEIYQSANYVSANSLPSINSLSRARHSFSLMRIQLARYVMNKNPEKASEISNNIQKARTDFTAALAEFGHLNIDNKNAEMLQADRDAIGLYFPIMD